MTHSPPENPAQFRGKTLTPVSPKPVHFPSPSNIPILEQSMDPSFNESAAVAQATPASFQQDNTYRQYMPSSTNIGTGSLQAQDALVGGITSTDGGANAYGVEGSNGPDTTSTIQQSLSTQFPTNSASNDLAQDQNSSYDPTAFAQGAHTQAAAPEPSVNNGNAGVDFQSLLDQLSASTSAGVPQDALVSPNSTLPSHPNLPPRPPPQEKPATHPNFAPDDDIRSYHPHSQKNPSARGTTLTDNPRSERGGAAVPDSGASATGSLDDDAPWPADIQRLFDQFLQDERANVTEGQWDKFPPGSRLFIGNLPTEKVTKRDLFHVFHKYGRLAQISLKQAYGFVQFLDSDACSRALKAEQNSAVRGRKMHLEISKPQRGGQRESNKDSGNQRNRRRSRSPEYSRGGNGANPRNVDRYTSGHGPGGGRDRDYRRSRDDYRPRSPSPRGRGGRDRYSRDRSRSPYGGRYRDHSPRRDSIEDELPLPRRPPHQVPDVQVIILDSVDSQFVQYVENIFQQRGLRTNALHMSPRLSEAAVIRRQIVEGVQAVVKLTYSSQNTVKIPLQVFDRRGGADNVRFEEYQDLAIEVAAEIVSRAKQTHQAPGAPSYGSAIYAMPAPAQAPVYGIPAALQPVAAANPALASMIGSLDGAALQQLLATLGQSQTAAAQPQQQATHSSGLTPDLSRLLGTLNSQASYSQPGPPPTGAQGNGYPQGAYNSLYPNTNSSQNTQGPPASLQGSSNMPSQGQPDMQDILAQLAAYKR